MIRGGVEWSKIEEGKEEEEGGGEGE